MTLGMKDIGHSPDTLKSGAQAEHLLEADADAQFGGAKTRSELERRLVRKIDLRMSILVLIYILNFVRSPPCSESPRPLSFSSQTDRNNVAAARLKGLEEDLQLKGASGSSTMTKIQCNIMNSLGQEFATVLSIFYVGYISIQIPS
jgi:hypothetical protein